VSVLVDTSVWIRFLAGKEPYGVALDRLLVAEDVVGHPFVFGELLVGDTGGRTRLLTDYAALPQAAMVPHDDVVAFVRHRKLAGKGAGFIDVHLLAAALNDDVLLWTADPRLRALAVELDCAFDVQ
jgi:predicted nucleic acid-binding protein